MTDSGDQIIGTPTETASGGQNATERVTIVDYDPRWPGQFATERDLLTQHVSPPFIDHEHIGSTAVPNQRAKPIIDMMASVAKLPDADSMIPQLAQLGYVVVETGMKNRYLLRKPAAGARPAFHLHIVAKDTWAERKERLMRDYLREHPGAVTAYGQLKARLAIELGEDSAAYTRAKTDFIQELIDRARDARGLPRIDVWND